MFTITSLHGACRYQLAQFTTFESDKFSSLFFLKQWRYSQAILVSQALKKLQLVHADYTQLPIQYLFIKLYALAMFPL